MEPQFHARRGTSTPLRLPNAELVLGAPRMRSARPLYFDGSGRHHFPANDTLGIVKRHQQRNRVVVKRGAALGAAEGLAFPPYEGPSFLFVPDGTSAPPGAISVDGLVTGAALHISHWRGNQTPAELKADTSTEIALNFVQSSLFERWQGRPLVNNHFDTDGVLTAWTCLHPTVALLHRELLIAAAEAGDFGEWPADERGLWIDAAITKIGEDAEDETQAYERAIALVPELLRSIKDYRHLWGPLEDALNAAKKAVNDGRITVLIRGHLGVIIREPGAPELHAPLITRMLKRCWRYLLAEQTPTGQFLYRYELPYHAWAETVVRPAVPIPDPQALKAELGSEWGGSHLAGLTAVIGTIAPISAPPERIIQVLEACDGELRAGAAPKFNRY